MRNMAHFDLLIDVLSGGIVNTARFLCFKMIAEGAENNQQAPFLQKNHKITFGLAF